MELRRSGRTTRKPSRYLLLGESYQAITIDSEEDPENYKEALEDVDALKWLKAMDREMGSMYSNSVWSLVEAPKVVKLIRCKWIYKRKRRPDGKVETFKARLVAKGYTQKDGVDYEETFSPVAMLKSIRILLAVAASLDYKIWQMDVKTAFLNGSLEEDIYMQHVGPLSQPNLFWRIRTESEMPCYHSITQNPIFAEAISNFGQAHKHLHLTKYFYHEDIQAFSK